MVITEERPEVRRPARSRLLTVGCWLLVVPFVPFLIIRLFGLERGFPLVHLVAFTPYIALASLVPIVVAGLTRRLWPAVAATVALLVLAACVIPRWLSSSNPPGATGPELRVLSVNLMVGSAGADEIVALVRSHRVDLVAFQEYTTQSRTALGVNDDEIGSVVKRALDTPYVGGISIQPQFGSGRSGPIDWTDRLTHTGVLARLGPQTGDLVTWRDLTALPCSHPHCCSVGYLLRDDSGTWRSLTAIVGHERLLTFLDLAPDLVANRIADVDLPAALRVAVRDSLLGLLSEQSSLSHPRIGELWRDICANCDLGIGGLLSLTLPGGQQRLRRTLAERVKRITVKPFMDMATMIEERLMQCCVHVATRSAAADHQCAPFCAVQAWPALARQRLPVRILDE